MAFVGAVRLRRPRARQLLVVLLAIGGAVGLLGMWALSSPAGSSPDDDFHLSSIWCPGAPAAGVAGPRLCAPLGYGPTEAGVVRRWVPIQVVQTTCFAFKASDSQACTYQLSNGLSPGRANAGLYPGGFYRVMHLFVGGSVGTSVLRMRLFNGAVGVVFVGAALALARGALRRAGAITWAITTIPLGLFLIPSTNPSSWAVIGLGTLWIFLLRFLDTDRGIGTWLAGVGALASYALAAVARTDAPALAAVVLFACIVFSGPSLWRSWRIAAPAILILVSGVLFLHSSGGGVVSNGLGAGSPAAKLTPALVAADALYNGHPVQLLLTNLIELPSLFLGMFGAGFGGLGWLDTPMPPLVGILVVAAVAGFVVLGWRRLDRFARLALLVVAAGLVAVPLWILQHSQAVVGVIVQPRYVYPLAFVGIGIAVFGVCLNSDRPWLDRRRGRLLWFALVIAQSYALHTEIQRYVSGLQVARFTLDFGQTWWWRALPLSPMSVWILGILASGAMFAGLLILGGTPQRPDDSTSDRTTAQ